ncbi:hypothetical protein C8R45DRAFT_600083 [Mycena sanguinolenta]|nr:hypothetical protein C8R45DRAFT_600083 [Mycena sanguinolenta]
MLLFFGWGVFFRCFLGVFFLGVFFVRRLLACFSPFFGGRFVFPCFSLVSFVGEEERRGGGCPPYVRCCEAELVDERVFSPRLVFCFFFSFRFCLPLFFDFLAISADEMTRTLEALKLEAKEMRGLFWKAKRAVVTERDRAVSKQRWFRKIIVRPRLL